MGDGESTRLGCAGAVERVDDGWIFGANGRRGTRVRRLVVGDGMTGALRLGTRECVSRRRVVEEWQRGDAAPSPWSVWSLAASHGVRQCLGCGREWVAGEGETLSSSAALMGKRHTATGCSGARTDHHDARPSDQTEPDHNQPSPQKPAQGRPGTGKNNATLASRWLSPRRWCPAERCWDVNGRWQLCSSSSSTSWFLPALFGSQQKMTAKFPESASRHAQPGKTRGPAT